MPDSTGSELAMLIQRIRELASDSASLNNPVLDQLLAEAARELLSFEASIAASDDTIDSEGSIPAPLPAQR